jgi:hypothetical protein
MGFSSQVMVSQKASLHLNVVPCGLKMACLRNFALFAFGKTLLTLPLYSLICSHSDFIEVSFEDRRLVQLLG